MAETFKPRLDIDAFKVALGALCLQAREDGLPPSQIAQALSSEAQRANPDLGDHLIQVQ